MSATAERFDFVIVGAGSAGCVLANRLSADGSLRILLLEAGGRDLNPFIHMPAGLAQLVHNTRLNWSFSTEPEPQLAGRRLYWPRGRVLGGSSSINAMCYTRGHAQDYDEWAQDAGPGWDYSQVLPWFLKAEDQSRGTSPWHGTGGPLSVEDLRFRNPLSERFVRAGIECGLPLNEDFNGPVQEGVGFYQVTQRLGRRCSAAVGYLRPALRRPNLTLRTHALSERVLFSGQRAVGVAYRHAGSRRIALADGEVLLAAGSIGSPQLLMLSGIGAPEHLARHGIAIVAARPEVGDNLQDHLDFCTLCKCTEPISYDFTRRQELAVGLRYLLSRSGPGVSNIAEAGAFIRTHLAADARPDVQLHFVPAQLDDHGRNRLSGHGFTLHACVLRPASRGSVQLRSRDPAAAPLIRANYLSAGEDLRVLLAGIGVCRELTRAPAFAPLRGPEVWPGEDVRSEGALIEVVRRKAETIYHPVGTCRMGSDARSVVDPQLRVREVEGLRVIDASIMPRLIGGNTNAPTIMIAEKAAADILRGGGGL